MVTSWYVRVSGTSNQRKAASLPDCYGGFFTQRRGAVAFSLMEIETEEECDGIERALSALPLLIFFSRMYGYYIRW